VPLTHKTRNPDHAVRAGAAMVRRVHELREQWARLGKEGMRIGVSIHTGKAVVGCVGSLQRQE
jgi:class 3 adenylate cyclase